MMEYLAVAGGILSMVAMLLREVRLLMAEVRRWRKPKPKPSRKRPAKKEPSA